MITEIALSNFKCFAKETTIPFGPLNLLTGVNGTGKSSCLQPLLLMRQSLERNKTTTYVAFDGSCVELGGFLDAKNSAISRGEPLTFRFVSHNQEGSFGFKYVLRESAKDNMVADIAELSIDGQHQGNAYSAHLSADSSGRYWLEHAAGRQRSILYDFRPVPLNDDKQSDVLPPILNYVDFSSIHYVSADRLGPRDYYRREALSDFVNVGARGENTANVLSKSAAESVHPDLAIQDDAPAIVFAQTEAWLDHIFHGGKMWVTEHEANIVRITLNSDGSSYQYRPQNVGFGYSYALPIIVSGLIAKPGQVLIVENPEAHLHPSAQAAMARFLARVSTTGVQVFIESHSENVLNGLRVAVHDGEIAPEYLNVLYFLWGGEQPFVKIQVAPDGTIGSWPEGFFDQTDKDFDRLFGA